MSSQQPKPSAEVQLKALRWAMGYIENASDRTVTIGQDDATKSFSMRFGGGGRGDYIYADSFSELMQKLVEKWEAERDID